MAHGGVGGARVPGSVRSGGRKDRLRARIGASLILVVVVGAFASFLGFPLDASAAASDFHEAHLWLQIDPGVYVHGHPDPWVIDSWVDFIDYQPNGIYDATLTVTNRGLDPTDVFLLIALPNTTTTGMFSSVRISGGVDGTRTYVLSDFGRTDYNPYIEPTSDVDPERTPYRQYESGSHGVYPGSGNANWATYHVGNMTGRIGETADTDVLSVRLTLGPSPSTAFKIHFDAYSYEYTAAGAVLEYWVPPSHDATEADDGLAGLVPAEAVDVSGDNRFVAVGWGRNLSFFRVDANPPDRLRWSVDTGRQVTNVVLSEDGRYLAATSNDIPFNATSRAWLSLYRTDPRQLLLHEQLDSNVVISPRPLDIARNGSYVAVGTAGWGQGFAACSVVQGIDGTGTVYLFDNPELVPGGGSRTYTRHDCVMGVRFSGNGQHLAVGFFWAARGGHPGVDVLSVPNLGLEASGPITGDPVYSVSISYNGRNVTTGQGWTNNVTMWDFTPGDNTLNWRWTAPPNTVLGTQLRQAISDDGRYVLVKQVADDNGPNPFPAFFVFNSTVPPDPTDKQPEWRFDPTVPFPQGIDLSVANARYGVGGDGVHVRLWGDGFASPPPGPNPAHTFVTNGTVTDAAFSYAGPIFAATDMEGYLYVFDASLSGDRLLWFARTPFI